MNAWTNKIVHFQVFDQTLYALDAQGTLWRNDNPPTNNGWSPILGPTLTQRSSIEKSYRIDKNGITDVTSTK